MDELIRIITTACTSAVGVVVSTIIAIIQKIKKDNVKKSDVLYEKLVENTKVAEDMYKPIEEKGINCSAMKKQFVLSDLQNFANTKGIKYVSEIWETELEKLIEFSKKVNAVEEKIKGVI